MCSMCVFVLTPRSFRLSPSLSICIAPCVRSIIRSCDCFHGLLLHFDFSVWSLNSRGCITCERLISDEPHSHSPLPRRKLFSFNIDNAVYRFTGMRKEKKKKSSE